MGDHVAQRFVLSSDENWRRRL